MTKKPHEILKDWSKAVTMIDPEKFDFLKEEIPRIIRVRTRLGKGVENGQITKLKPLSENYIKARKKTSLSEFTKPTRSNLTLTGKMLDSIIGIRLGLRFIFTFKDTESNDKARWNTPDRNFFELSKSEINGVYRQARKVLLEELRSIFKS